MRRSKETYDKSRASPQPQTGMRHPARGVVLVATQDEALDHQFANALCACGFQTVTAYDAYSVEYTLQHRNIDVVVVDERILGPVSEKRPGPILAKCPGVRLVVENASFLDSDRRKLVVSRQGKLLEGTETSVLVAIVEQLLPAVSSVSTGSPALSTMSVAGKKWATSGVRLARRSAASHN